MRYLNALKNQLLVARGWMFATLVMSMLCVYLVIKLTSISMQMTVRLVPQEFDANNGPVEVTQNLHQNLEYITAIAVADLRYYTDWTPHSVLGQHSRFANRMTPALYTKQGLNLVMDAEKFAKSERSQTFFMEGVEARQNEVSIQGRIVIWQGQEQVSNAKMAYTIKYQSISGLPKIISFNASSRG